MKRSFIGMFVLVLLVSMPVFAGHIIDQATFGPEPAYEPSVAVSTSNYTAIAYLVQFGAIPEQQVMVQLVPTNPNTDEMWPEPVGFGPGSSPKVCWSREGFTVGFVSGDAVVLYQSDEYGVWDTENPHLYIPGGPVIGFDMWGLAHEWAGTPVYLTIDTSMDPPTGSCRVYCGLYSEYFGWSVLNQLVSGLSNRPMSRARTTAGPGGPLPAVYYLQGMYETELYRIMYINSAWTEPEPVPGDSGPGSAISGPFDVESHHFLGLGPAMMCPCRDVLFKEHNRATGGWYDSVNLTVNHGEMNYAQSPSVAYLDDFTTHLFWKQETYNAMVHDRDHLEYWTYNDGVLEDRSFFLDHILAGVGSKVDISAMPGGDATVMAWSRVDTLDGVPQPERIFMARFDYIYPLDAGDMPKPALDLTAWPNPFNPRINLTVAMEAEGSLQLDVYDARGLLIRHLHDGLVTGNERTFTWDGTSSTGRSVPSGVYFVQAITPRGQMTEKIVLAE